MYRQATLADQWSSSAVAAAESTASSVSAAVTDVAETSPGLTSNLVGLLAGVGTFLLICTFFALAACVSMCRLRVVNSRIQRELNRQADNEASRHSTRIQTDQGVVILLSLEHASINSTKNGVQNGAYAANASNSDTAAVKHQIVAEHFLKNGFHHVIDDETPVKQKVARVLSTPPLLVRDMSADDQEQKNSNDNSMAVTSLELPENSMRRSRSLKSEAGRPKREEIELMCPSANNKLQIPRLPATGNDVTESICTDDMVMEFTIPVPTGNISTSTE